MSYDIKLEGIITNGKHGVYESEKLEQQLFLIDLVIVSSSTFDLIETLAKYLYENLISPKMEKLTVTVHKPNTSLNKKTKDISVTYSG